MAKFMDLPKAVREKIYRLHLIAKKQPVTLDEYKKTCGYTKTRRYRDKNVQRKMPPLLHASSKIEDEASLIYFGENVFAFDGPEDLDEWRGVVWPCHTNHMTKVALMRWSFLTPAAADKAFKNLWKLPKLDFVAVLINEEDEVRRSLYNDPIIRCGGRSGMGPQINLQLLRLPGMQSFRSLRGVRELRFIVDEVELEGKNRRDFGSIPGGLLESIRHEILFTGDVASKRHDRPFRFLDLPAELRNIIYGKLLLFPGATYPIAAKPVSVTSQYKHKPYAARAALVTPRSALDILLVNRQIHDEAYGLFYQNDLVFPTPARLQMFMVSLGDKRLECLRSLTFFNEYGHLIDKIRRRGRVVDRYPPYISSGLDGEASEGTDKWEVAMLSVQRLPNLQKLHFLYRNRTMAPISDQRSNPGIARQRRFLYADAKFMSEMRNISDIKVRDLDMEIIAETCDLKRMAYVESKAAALKHLNHGLQLAQQGMVVHELFAGRDWREDNLWPVLQGSDCGFSRGCRCGSNKD